MKIVLMGPPASGKGSQASLIEKTFSLPHISTGDMFREIMKENTSLGRQVRVFMDNAQMVPDNISIKVVENHLLKPKFKNGFVLDGYPRTLNQAKQLDQIMNIDMAILLDASKKQIVDRVLARVICTNCGEVYSTKFYKGNFCLVCGHALKARKDDKANIILKRISEYEQLTLPAIEHYKKKGLLKVIKGDSSIETMFSDIKKLLTKNI